MNLLLHESLLVKMEYILNCITLAEGYMLDGRQFAAGCILGSLQSQLKDYVVDLRDDQIGQAAWKDADDNEDI